MDTNSNIKPNDTPQCDDVSHIQSSFKQLNLSLSETQEHDWLSNLPEDVLFIILLYIGPNDCEDVKLVNHSLHNATSLSQQLWREFCILTGKCLEKKYANATTNSKCDDAFRPMMTLSNDGLKKETVNEFRSYYHRNPCVPIDFETISSALAHCPRTPMKVLADESDLEYEYDTQGTVCLMPGVYQERIVVKGEVWNVGSAVNKSISIRACFPLQGATIMHYTDSEDAKNQPCVSVLTRDAETLEGVQKGISVNLSHLALLHSTSGSDLWGGNTAVFVDGARARVVMNSCVVQSHSGRGIVVTNQAELQISSSTVCDCAATGFFLGDWGSRAHVSRCNIVRNGYGSRRSLSSHEGRQELDNVLTEWTRLRANAGGIDVSHQIEQFNVVPPGHSGIYIEGAMCWIEDTLIASNCFTGTSVVRNGFLSLSGCDIAQNSGNGHPISIEDEHDVGNNRLQGARIRGGVVEGPRHNDYSNSKKYEEKLRNGASFAYNLVGAPMTEKKLHDIIDTAN
mmetsp:Transcript_5324/g.8158  ORF Transcript_5324/g.8158 Transcript_5324/m.8158 type:complete len:511 (-) Transcript_5324:2443-3975(-)